MPVGWLASRPIFAKIMHKARKLPLIGGGIVVALAVSYLLLPAQVQVEREIHIDAPRATVFALVNDFRQYNKWSNWLDDDPNARLEFAGAERGAGAIMQWSGNIVGQGRQEITASVPFDVHHCWQEDDGFRAAGSRRM